MQTKKKLLRTIRKETKPPKGFSQWLFILERRKLSDSIGLCRLEAENGGKPEWSAALQINLPEDRKFGPDGKEIPSEWEKIGPGQSLFNVFTVELRGKSVIEVAKGWLKRSFEEGKLQDMLPIIKG